jgi:hypothetical protein
MSPAWSNRGRDECELGKVAKRLAGGRFGAALPLRRQPEQTHSPPAPLSVIAVDDAQSNWTGERRCETRRARCAGRPRRQFPIVPGMAGPRRAAANLVPATCAVALCFTAWSLIAPFAKTFKHDLGLNYTQVLLLTAIPVVLGSLLRCRSGS